MRSVSSPTSTVLVVVADRTTFSTIRRSARGMVCLTVLLLQGFMECAMTIQCANVVVDIVSCILDKLCRQVRNVSSVWVSSISLKLVHLFAVADLGGGGGRTPPQLWNLKKYILIAIADWLLQRFFFGKKKCNMLMHTSSNPPPPPFTKSLDPPLLFV